MKQSEQTKRIHENMKPGVISLSGFLGNDTRELQQIIEEDNGIVSRMDLTHADIAARMQEFRNAGSAGLGEYITVFSRFEVRVESVRGKLPCPFGDPGIFPKTNITVRNTRSGREITFTDLNIHMIREHGFYEGHGSPFRLNPEDLAAILEPAP